MSLNADMLLLKSKNFLFHSKIWTLTLTLYAYHFFNVCCVQGEPKKVTLLSDFNNYVTF